MPRVSIVVAMVAVAGLAGSGCSIVGPSCLSRQKTGPAATASGRAEPGQVVSAPAALRPERQPERRDHQLERPGPARWTAAAHLRHRPPHARTSCRRPADERRTGRARSSRRGGGYLGPCARGCTRNGSCTPTPDEIVNTSLIVTGPGNGAPADFREYKFHVVGDPSRAVSYSLTALWFFGPDC